MKRVLPSACVIGAGSSGIAAVKALTDAGIRFDCFERSDRVGGNWVFGNRNGMSACYRELHINTSRDRMAYADFAMPADYPDYPRHDLIARYFDAYVDRFALRDRITFETTVERVTRLCDGGFEVRLDDGRARRYDAVLVANGHHWDPRWPEPPFPGGFAGTQMHAHEYVDDEPLRGRRVVVVGMGNSAMDIAVESSRVAAATFLAARRGVHVVPKYMLGRTSDSILPPAWVPWRLRRRLAELALCLTVGEVTRYGLPRPDHRLLEAHPTISGDILDRLARGTLAVKPNVAELRGDRVLFADGSEEPADVIVHCTGYKVSFPFFDPGFVSAPDNELPLYRRVFHPDVAGLYFIGLLQPLGAVMPLAEAQSKWVAAHLRGEYALPARATVLRDIADEREAMRRRYVTSKRHTMQVDFDDYLRDLRRERGRGARRARRAGHALPVPPRAAVANSTADTSPSAASVSGLG